MNAVFGEKSVVISVLAKRIWGEPDKHYRFEIPYDPTHVVPRADFRPNPETSIWIPQRWETIHFLVDVNFEGAGQGIEEYWDGPYSTPGKPEEKPSLLLLNSETASPIILSLGDVYNEILGELRKGKQLHDLSPRGFEEFVAGILDNQGFKVELTKKTRDGGYDLIAICANPLGLDTRLIVECKRYHPKNAVGISVVRELWGVLNDPRNRFERGIVATSSYVSRDARKAIDTTYWRLATLDHDALMSFAGFKREHNGLWLPG